MEEQKGIQMQQQSNATTPSPQGARSTTIPNQPTDIPVPTSTQPKKSFLKKPILWIAVVILLLFAGSNYFIYSNLENQISKITNKTKQTALPTKTNPEKMNVYTNKRYGFTLGYPTDWNLDSDPSYIDIENLGGILLESSCNYDSGDHCSTFNLEISQYDQAKGLQPLHALDIPKQNINEKEITFNGLPAKEIFYFDPYVGNSTGLPMGRFMYVLLIHRDMSLYTITYQEWSKKRVVRNMNEWKHKETLDQILKTLTFISPVPYQEPEIKKFTTFSKDDLQGFPIYTNAVFIEKVSYPKCTHAVPAYNSCHSTTYMFTTPDDGDSVNDFYKTDPLKSGWICEGGGGEYLSSRSFTGMNLCQKKDRSLKLFLSATPSATTIEIAVPNY